MRLRCQEAQKRTVNRIMALCHAMAVQLCKQIHVQLCTVSSGKAAGQSQEGLGLIRLSIMITAYYGAFRSHQIQQGQAQESCSWGGITSCTATSEGFTCWKAVLGKRTWESCGTSSSPSASNVPSWPWRPKVFWSTSRRTWPVVWEKFSSATLPWWGHFWSTVSSYRITEW